MVNTEIIRNTFFDSEFFEWYEAETQMMAPIVIVENSLPNTHKREDNDV